MIDPLALLAPLILLPIVLLLAFLGCGLQTAGSGILPEPPFDTPVTLTIMPFEHIAAGVKSVEVMFTADVGQHRTSALTLTPSDVKPGNQFNDFNLVNLVEAGTVACKCLVTYEGGDTDDAEAVHEKVSDEPLVEFKLARDDHLDFFFWAV